jgi:hypothetical protein
MLAEEAPALLVLATQEDTPNDWLNSGQALQRVLLTECDAGLQASYDRGRAWASAPRRRRDGTSFKFARARADSMQVLKLARPPRPAGSRGTFPPVVSPDARDSSR